MCSDFQSMQFGLIGKTLSYSYSQKFFQKLFQEQNLPHNYTLYELENICEFPQLLHTNSQLIGLNVTIPYKTEILNFVDEMDSCVIEIGATNCLFIDRSYGQKIYAFNTDVQGFAKSFHKEARGRKFLRALILGSGGASKAVRYVLENEQIACSIVSRKKGKDIYTYAELDKCIIDNHELIVQCTPVGTFPNIDDFPPFPYQYLGKQHLVIDLIYNPAQSKFLQLALAKGAQTANGQIMLEAQAEAAWKIWQRYLRK